MTEDVLYTLLATVPAKATRVLVVFEEKDGFRCKWIGLTAEEAATALYGMADGIVDQKIPSRAWKPPG